MSASVSLATSVADVRKFYRLFDETDGVLAFDTETTGLQVRSGWHDFPRTVQFSWRPWHHAVVIPTTPQYLKAIRAFFARATEVIGHNLKFDLHALETYGVDVWQHPETAYHDTVWVSRLHDERERAGLKSLAVKYLDDSAADEQTKLKRLMRSHGWTWATVPVEHLVEYGGTDALITGQLFDTLYPEISHSRGAYAREQRLLPVLYAMERSGTRVDEGLLAKVIEEEQAAEAEALRVLEDLSPGLNPNAPAQLVAAFRSRGLEIPDTKAVTLKALDDDLARAVLAYRHHKKTLSTYALPWSKLVTPMGRLHPSYNSLGAATGRMSSSDPNLQNVTRGHRLRDIFIAAPGHTLVVADWDQMELRLYAHFAEDENMRAAFLSGDDIYQQAADLLDVPRQVGKMMMLASIYGAGWRKVKAQAIEMAYAQGDPGQVEELEAYDWQALHRRFHAQYKIQNLARMTELVARRRAMFGEGYVTTLGGRRQRPKMVKLKSPSTDAVQVVPMYKDLSNALVQGSSADLMKQALIGLADLGWKDALRLTVHDEVVLEVPDESVEMLTADILAVMTHREFVPPLTAGVSAATSYGHAK